MRRRRRRRRRGAAIVDNALQERRPRRDLEGMRRGGRYGPLNAVQPLGKKERKRLARRLDEKRRRRKRRRP